jgi:hypothetical protein
MGGRKEVKGRTHPGKGRRALVGDEGETGGRLVLEGTSEDRHVCAPSGNLSALV